MPLPPVPVPPHPHPAPPTVSLLPPAACRIVATPGGQELVSMHGSGEDVVFIPRSRVLPGEYIVSGEWAKEGGRCPCASQPGSQFLPHARLGFALLSLCCPATLCSSHCRAACLPAVLGSSDQSSFRLVVEKFARQRQLADEDRAVLTQVQQAQQ